MFHLKRKPNKEKRKKEKKLSKNYQDGAQTSFSTLWNVQGVQKRILIKIFPRLFYRTKL